MRLIMGGINGHYLRNVTEQLPERLWQAVTDPKWKIDGLRISALGELVGWALPDRFPPRNGRTSKSLRSLGWTAAVRLREGLEFTTSGYELEGDALILPDRSERFQHDGKSDVRRLPAFNNHLHDLRIEQSQS
jgi:hypothetical protein